MDHSSFEFQEFSRVDDPLGSLIASREALQVPEFPSGNPVHDGDVLQNDQPASRPASALGYSSDDSYVNMSDSEDENEEYCSNYSTMAIPKRVRMSVAKRDGKRCLLCPPSVSRDYYIYMVCGANDDFPSATVRHLFL